MAIFRKGVRIGNYDIRIGWPRDKSLQDIPKDPRLTEHLSGVSPETHMGHFISKVNKAEGFSRTGRYFVLFSLPKGEDTRNIAQNEEMPTGSLKGINNKLAETVGLFCNKVTVPDRTLASAAVEHHGPARHFVHSHTYEPITATFYADLYMRERMYFEAWQKAAISNTTHNVNFYDDYTAEIHIMGLGQYANTVSHKSKQPEGAISLSRADRLKERYSNARTPSNMGDRTWQIALLECFPARVGAPEMSAESNEIVQFDVTFTYRYWLNGYIDQLGNLDYGTDLPIQPEVRGKSFKIPFLNKLPEELRRTGRDTFNQLRTRIPFGKITRGIVFPPFS